MMKLFKKKKAEQVQVYLFSKAFRFYQHKELPTTKLDRAKMTLQALAKGKCKKGFFRLCSFVQTRIKYSDIYIVTDNGFVFEIEQGTNESDMMDKLLMIHTIHSDNIKNNEQLGVV